MNSLNLLGKRVRYNGETGVVVSRSEPEWVGRDRLAAQGGSCVTIRIEGQHWPHFVEVRDADLASIEVVDD